MPDWTKTLDELEGREWGEPTFDSHLVQTCHALRKKPVCGFTVEDLRIMIGQSIGLPFLVPKALDVLEQSPFAEGDFYPGDLLVAILGSDPTFWRTHADFRQRAIRISDTAQRRLPELQGEENAGIRDHIVSSVAAFLAQHGD